MPADNILGWLLIGLLAGILGRLVMPGRDPGGFIVTVLFGIAGALLGGYLALLIGWQGDTALQHHVAAIAGAIASLALYRLIIRRRVP